MVDLCFFNSRTIPQIARSIGVLTSNSMGAWLGLWRKGWCHGGVPFLGAIRRCYGWVSWKPWWGAVPKTCDVLYFDLDRLENLFTTPRYR